MDLQNSSVDPITKERRAGVCLPLWSLVHRESFESGDFLTIQKLIPFLKESGFSILQILPLNDCGFGSSPYSSLSGFAMDSLYLSPKLSGISLFSRKEKIATHSINKQRITELKLDSYKQLFEKNFKQCEKIAEDFLQKFSWVKPYTVFKYFYKKYKGIHWLEWEKTENINGYSTELWDKMSQDTDIRRDFLWEAWIQSECFKQLSSMKKRLEEEKIYLKGDMPILTSGNSCDVWLHRDFYRMDLQAGAPPDAFSDIGQNWGFPVVDWAKMGKSGYLPWKEKLQYQENFFHLYRIDHVIGLYRIWAIPQNAPNAKYGYFYPQGGISTEEFAEKKISPKITTERGLTTEIHPGSFIFHWDFHKEKGFGEYTDEEKEKLYALSFGNIASDEKYWKEAGERVLDAFSSFTNMVPCAEDLGSVPGFVRDSIHERQLLGMDVIRWTRSFEDGSFIPPKNYRKNAISTLATHDTSLALDWWMNECGEEERNYLREYFSQAVGEILSRENQSHPIENSLEKTNFPRNDLSLLLDFAFSTNSQFSIQMLSDLLISAHWEINEDWNLHKTNVPGTPEEKNWKYRFGFLAEDLCEDRELVSILASKIQSSSRMVKS